MQMMFEQTGKLDANSPRDGLHPLSSKISVHATLTGLLPLVWVDPAECSVWQCLEFRGRAIDVPEAFSGATSGAGRPLL